MPYIKQGKWQVPCSEVIPIIDVNHCWLITIGDDCLFAPRVTLLAHDASTKAGTGFTKIGRVDIGNRVFLGAGVIVLPGTTIGDDAIVGAGSLVSADIAPGAVASGIPARTIGRTDEYLERHRKQQREVRCYTAQRWTIAGGITDEDKQRMREELGNGIAYVE